MLAHGPDKRPCDLGQGSGRGLRSARLETFPAKHRTSLRRTERNRSLLSASRASGLRLNLCEAVGLAGHWGCAQHGHPFCLAGFTTLGFVLELLVVEEE